MTSKRLNKDMRAQLVEAAMEKWKESNPEPKDVSVVNITRAVARKLKDTRAQRRTMVAMARGTDVHDMTDHVRVEHRVHYLMEMEDGSLGGRLDTMIPTAIADEVGLEYNPDFTRELRADCHAVLERYADENGITKVLQFVEASYPQVEIARTSPEATAARKQRRESLKWQKAHHALARETRQALEQFNTTKQLHDGWPEMAALLPGVTEPTMALVVATDEISARLGLNKGEQQ